MRSFVEKLRSQLSQVGFSLSIGLGSRYTEVLELCEAGHAGHNLSEEVSLEHCINLSLSFLLIDANGLANNWSNMVREDLISSAVCSFSAPDGIPANHSSGQL